MTETDATDIDRSVDEDPTSQGAVGRSVPKVEGRGIVTGQAEYTDDMPTENALAVEIVRSPHAHARIETIDTADAAAIDGVHAVLTHEDVPGDRYARVTFGGGSPPPQGAPYDERILDEKVRFVGDPVAIIAAETADIAAEAAERVEVEYDELEAVFDPAEAKQPEAPVIHDEDDYGNAYDSTDLERNVIAQQEHEEGDVESGLAAADTVVEDTYETQIVQQAPMEVNTTVAEVDAQGRLIVRTSTQIPHLTREMLAQILGLDRNEIRVVVPQVGGGFGHKSDVVPSQIYASVLALETGETVRIENSRAEDLNTVTTRHAMELRVKAGVTEDGTLTAIHLDITSNSGAYAGHAAGPMHVAGLKPLSLYAVENRKFTGETIYTNLPMGGAMRAYGIPQGVFALESHMDQVADAIGMEPVELRRKNIVSEGDVPFGSSDRPLQSVGLDECIDEACAAVGWDDGPEDPEEDHLERGLGISLSTQSSGDPGDEYSEAEVVLERDGTITLITGAGDMGQGTETTQSQIAADVLGVATDDVSARIGDTDLTPWDNGAYADSTTYVSGHATLKAAEDLKDRITEYASRWLDGDPDEFVLDDGDIVSPDSERLPLDEFANKLFESDTPRRRLKGRAEHVPTTSPPSFSAQIAAVEVNTETGEFDVLGLYNAVDCGFAINPEHARGQIIGAATMGLGQALCEHLTFDDDGDWEQTGLDDYEVLRSTDVPDTIETTLVESHEPSGPFGAKSVGQIANSGPLAAVPNAIEDAVGVRIDELPVTAEKLSDEL